MGGMTREQVQAAYQALAAKVGHAEFTIREQTAARDLALEQMRALDNEMGRIMATEAVAKVKR